MSGGRRNCGEQQSLIALLFRARSQLNMTQEAGSSGITACVLVSSRLVVCQTLSKKHSHRSVSPPSKRLFQFFLGRRCEDDDRQVGRWDRVAGEASGRWRRILLQKYRQKGVCESSFPPTGPHGFDGYFAHLPANRGASNTDS